MSDRAAIALGVALGSSLLLGACSDPEVEYSIRVGPVMRHFDDLAALEEEWGHEVLFPAVPDGFELVRVVLSPVPDSPSSVVSQWDADGQRRQIDLSLSQRPAVASVEIPDGEEIQVAGTRAFIYRFPAENAFVHIDWRSCDRDFRVIANLPTAAEEQAIEAAASIIRQC